MAYYNPDMSLGFSNWDEPQLCCPQKSNRNWLTKGCQYRSEYLAAPGGKSVACKNGIPYDCKCNIIKAPYSLPYEACPNKKPRCKQGSGVWYVRPPYFFKQT